MGECDGMFLIFDAARHGGWEPSISDVESHIDECDDCSRLATQAIGEDGQDLMADPVMPRLPVAELRVWDGENGDLVESWERAR